MCIRDRCTPEAGGVRNLASAFAPRSDELPALKREAEPGDLAGWGFVSKDARAPRAPHRPAAGAAWLGSYLWMKFFFSRYSMADEI